MRLKTIAMAVLAVLIFASGTTAKKSYSITLKVQEEKSIENQHGALYFNRLGGSYGHGVAVHIFAVGTDDNVYDLVPKDSKDFIVAGEYPARFDNRNLIVLVNRREIKLFIVDVKSLEAETEGKTAKQ
jgi:hypothetical protein